MLRLRSPMERGLLPEEVVKIVSLIDRYVGIEEEHHRQWLFDQVLRQLLGSQYDAWVIERDAEAEGSYKPWDVGIAP
jgi:hypothetical protein